MTRERDDAPTDCEVLLAEIRLLPGCEKTKRRVIRLLESHAGERVYLARRYVQRPEQVAAARRMLRGGAERIEVMRRLVAVYGVSQATAYRRIAKALDGRW